MKSRVKTSVYSLIGGLLLATTANAETVTTTATFTGATVEDRTDADNLNTDTAISNGSWSDLYWNTDATTTPQVSVKSGITGMVGESLYIGRSDNGEATVRASLNLNNPVLRASGTSVVMKVGMMNSGAQEGGFWVTGMTADNTVLFRFLLGTSSFAVSDGASGTVNPRYKVATLTNTQTGDAVDYGDNTVVDELPTASVWANALVRILTVSLTDTNYQITWDKNADDSANSSSISGQYLGTGNLSKLTFRAIDSKASWQFDDIVITGTAAPISIPENDLFSTAKNSALSGANVLGNDINELSVLITDVTNPSHAKAGTFSVDTTTGAVTYEPEADWVGADTFTYKLDGKLATVSITVYDDTLNNYVGLINGEIGIDASSWSLNEFPSVTPGIIDIGDATLLRTAADDRLKDYDITLLSGTVSNSDGIGDQNDPVDGPHIKIDGGTWIHTGAGGDIRDNTIFTVTSGSLVYEAPIRVRESSVIEIVDGDVNLNAVSDNRLFTNPDLGYSICLKAGGTGTFSATGSAGTVQWGGVGTPQDPANQPNAGFNFESGFLGKLVINLNDETDYNAWFEAGQIKVNGVAATDDGSGFKIAGKTFTEIFTVSSPSRATGVFELVIDPTFTPAIGFEAIQTGNELVWTVEDERGVKEYVINQEGSEPIIVDAKGLGEYSMTLNSDALVTITVVDNSGLSKTYGVTDGNKITLYYDLLEGWNLITIAGDDADLSNLETATNGQYWAWNGNSYELVETPQPTQGVWVYSDAIVEDILVPATKSDAEMTLKSGWNMVGPVTETVIPAEAHTIYSWNSIYEVVADEQSTLVGGVAYWIFTL